MRTLQAIVCVFLAPFLFVGFIALIVTSAYAFISYDSSAYTYVIDFCNPMLHVWIRTIMVIWSIASIFIGSLLGQFG